MISTDGLSYEETQAVVARAAENSLSEERAGPGQFAPVRRDISTLVPAGKMVTLDTADGLIERASKHEMVIDYSPEAMRIRDLKIAFSKLRPFLRLCPVLWRPYPLGPMLGVEELVQVRYRSLWTAIDESEDPEIPVLTCRCSWTTINAMLVATATSMRRGEYHHLTDTAAIIWAPTCEELPKPNFRQFMDAHNVEQEAV